MRLFFFLFASRVQRNGHMPSSFFLCAVPALILSIFPTHPTPSLPFVMPIYYLCCCPIPDATWPARLRRGPSNTISLVPHHLGTLSRNNHLPLCSLSPRILIILTTPNHRSLICPVEINASMLQSKLQTQKIQSNLGAMYNSH